jgi:hypothetical protein
MERCAPLGASALIDLNDKVEAWSPPEAALIPSTPSRKSLPMRVV